MADAPVDRVLLVRLGAMGDIVHAIPVAAALRRAYPAARIDWLVSARHRAILDLVPVVDHCVAVNDRRGARGGTGILAAIGQLRRVRYDVAIDMQGLIKSAVLARASGARRVVGFAARHVRERPASLFYTETYDPPGPSMRDHAARPTRHVIYANLGLLARLGLHVDRLEFPLADVDSHAAQALRERTGGRYALLNPGAAWPNKRWPPDRLGEVARRLRERHGLWSVVLWGPGEEALAKAVVVASAGAAVLSPRTSMADLVALARGAALMVSGDTGPTHVAAAVGTPIVGIYGPTFPARNGPWSPLDVIVSRDAVCRCHYQRRCSQPAMCLLDIATADVVEAIERRLAHEVSRA